MRRVIGLLISLLLYSIPSYPQTIDSLISVLPQEPSKQQIDILNSIVQHYVNQCQVKVAQSYHDQSKETLATVQYPKGQTLYFINQGEIYFCLRKIDSAKLFYEKALAIAKSHDLKLEQADALQSIAITYGVKREARQALNFLLQSKQLLNTLNNVEKELAISFSMGQAYELLKNLDSAAILYQYVEKTATTHQLKEYMMMGKAGQIKLHIIQESDQPIDYLIKETIQIAEELDEKMAICRLTNYAFEYYLELELPDEALIYLDKGIKANESIQNPQVMALFTAGYAKVYKKKQDFSKAKEYGIKAIQFAERIGSKIDLLKLYGDQASYYIGASDYKQAVDFAQKSIGLANELSDKDFSYNKYLAYEFLAQGYEKLGQQSKALLAYKKHLNHKLTFIENEQSERFAKLQTQFETEKKEAKIKDLSEQAILQALEIKQKNQGMIIGGFIIAFAALILYLIYLKRTSRMQMHMAEVEQRFLRSQLNPHFIFNALSSIQGFVLQQNAKTAVLYLAKFSRLMRQVLENSREEFIQLEEEASMLENYMELQALQVEELEYQIHMDELIEADQTLIPPMFVQPFIENAIEHGIIQGKGKIAIYFQQENEFITINVVDNGVGIEQAKKLKVIETQKHHSLATSIIKERIENYNQKLKTNIQLVISDLKESNTELQGTKVELKVPFKYL